jgi:hypothetical protein
MCGRLSLFAPLPVAVHTIYNESRLEGCRVKRKWIALNEAEWRLVIQALNDLRTSLIAEGRYTDTVDEVMLKIINAPVRRLKIA